MTATSGYMGPIADLAGHVGFDAAWVIEHIDSPPDRPMYWAGFLRDEGNQWRDDIEQAIRFFGEVDACLVADQTCDRVLPQRHRVTEHGWRR